jgi:hypothetical protein
VPACRPALIALTALAAVALSAPPVAAQFIRRIPEMQELEPARRAPVTFTPTLTIGEEFNDNVFLDNDNRTWDFITAITPGFTLEVERPTYRIFAAYDATAEIFARESDETHAFERQGFVGEAVYRVTPQLTLSLTDRFTMSTDTNQVTGERVATGRDRSWSNALAGGASWQATPLTSLRGGASWTVLRFDDEDLVESDTYQFQVGTDHALTPLLTGIAEYEFAIFDFSGLDTVYTHTPRVGLAYAFSPALSGSLRIGPTFEVSDGSTRVTPSVIGELRQRTRWGSVGLTYSHLVSTSGGLGGTGRDHSLGGTVTVSRLVRNLIVEVAPLLSIVDRRGDDSTIHSFTLPIQAAYRFNDYMALVAGYQFFLQRADERATTPGGTVTAGDVDQNRVFVGLQFGYPFRFD